ncbi:MAG: tetratricopeptide repeat protein, partial [Cyanobacteria bacterium]|nr:tetratricopeptide repeat protein [Cyanobacteriota bacterium]
MLKKKTKWNLIILGLVLIPLLLLPVALAGSILLYVGYQDFSSQQLEKGCYEALDTEKYQDATKICQRMVDNSTTSQRDPKHLYALATAYHMNNQYPEAIQYYQATLLLAPKYPDVYFNLGLAYGKNQQYDQSILMTQKAIDENPGDAEAYHNLGYAY